MNLLFLASAISLVSSCAQGPVTRSNASNSSASQIAHDSRAQLHSLYAQNHGARALGRKAKAVLVFPAIVKGGFIVGAQGGNGAMFRNDGSISGYYETASVSYGLQAGAQQFGYALFFMNNRASHNLDRSGRWEIGGSPNLVIVNQSAAASMSTTTMDKDIYAFFFNQRGLMGGLSLEGTKITRIHPRG